MNKADKHTPLKKGGVLAYIISDTFMTIKSHLPLRKMLMQNYIHKMIRVHPDTFRATVNTVVMIAERNIYEKDQNGKSIVSFDDQHICQMADLTNLSIHDAYDEFMQVLSQTKGVFFENTATKQNTVNQKYAIYYYPQALIRTNSNLPFFVASPKLFALMNDGNDASNKPKTELKEISGKQVAVRTISINEKEVEVVKLGDIADAKDGMTTGDNEYYLFQDIQYRGSYKTIEGIEGRIFSEAELVQLFQSNHSLKENIIKSGFNSMYPKNIVPYYKGGESDSEDGWLPNYFVKTPYYIDWSELSVSNLRSMTIADRIIKNKEDKPIQEHYYKVKAAVIRNPDCYFLSGLTFSRTGMYSPTFRLIECAIFDSKSNFLKCSIDTFVLIGLLNSKFFRFGFKNYLGHTVQSEGESIENFSITLIENSKHKVIVALSKSIIQAQKSNPRYDYASHEQIEIDKLVYEAYGLSADDVQEVENWYARRYPKLSNAQKANLRALGKSDDYLELYGLK